MFFPRHRPARTLTELFELRKERDVESGSSDRVHQILLASSGIPGAFPFREIDGSIYVDGGVTGNLLYGGARRTEDTPLAMWTALYPNLPVPTVRFWVIFNNQLRPLPQVTRPAWPAVFTRSLEMATRAATITAIRHLFAQAEIARLKHGGEMSKYSARDYCARVTDENS
jgi:predicted acylesterase/phospholipase RssA